MITNIQKYSIHDGDGIRTTVFFKGCPLNCLWCHNPETKAYEKQVLYDRERCIGCRQCELSCPYHAIFYHEGKVSTDLHACTRCGICLEYCARNLREITGTEYTVDELMELLRKDVMFYEQSGGGVTLSGGEVMAMDMDYIVALVKQLFNEGISVYIDTCGYTRYENFERILPYVDTFLYDLKVMDHKKHLKYVGTDNTLILDNLVKLSAAGARIIIRIPTILEVNGSNTDMDDLILWLQTNNITVAKINLLPYHNTGSGKLDKLGEPYIASSLHAPSDNQMQEFTEQFKKAGFHNIKIGG
jgi:pyruvate formate lyase activating enzyme